MSVRDLYDCERNNDFKKHPVESDRIRYNLDQSSADLDSAKKSYEIEDYKWPIVQAYYSILHASNALIRSKGYLVKDHYCVYLFLVILSDRGLFDSSLAHGYLSAYKDRHKANYDGIYDKATAESAIELAERFQAYIFKELNY
jgi:uncharacterized protein (UPF0332 family)